MHKNVVAGLGEIGLPILKILSRKNLAVGFDINRDLMNQKKYQNYEFIPTSFLHICIPFTKNFIIQVIELSKKFNPKFIVIHSTISPGTTKTIHELLKIPVIYSATRGIHKRMLQDLKRYTKFYALDSSDSLGESASKEYQKLMKSSGVKVKRMSNTLTLELAKIVVDTSYYGWLITYAQLSNMIAIKNKINYDEMWSFADEIHKFLGNRPKMYPGFIGGHCVIPNLDLIKNDTLDLIEQINNDYAKILKSKKN